MKNPKTFGMFLIFLSSSILLILLGSQTVFAGPILLTEDLDVFEDKIIENDTINMTMKDVETNQTTTGNSTLLTNNSTS